MRDAASSLRQPAEAPGAQAYPRRDRSSRLLCCEPTPPGMRSLALWARLVGWINGSTRRCCAIPDVAWYFAAASQQVIARQSTAVTVERNSGSRVQRQERAVNDCFSAAEQASRFGARQTHAGRRRGFVRGRGCHSRSSTIPRRGLAIPIEIPGVSFRKMRRTEHPARLCL